MYSRLDVIFGNLGTSSECTNDYSLRLTAKIDHCLLRYIEIYFSELDTVPHTVDFLFTLFIYCLSFLDILTLNNNFLELVADCTYTVNIFDK